MLFSIPERFHSMLAVTGKTSAFDIVLKNTNLKIKPFTSVPGSPVPVTSSSALAVHWHFMNTLKMQLYFSDT